MHEPIVITGLGAVSPLGVGVTTNWKRLIAGHSGIRTNTRFNTEGWKCRIAGLVPGREAGPEGFNPEAAMDPRDVRRTDLFIHYAMAAAQEALNRADWHPVTPAERTRTATVIGTGVGGVPAITGATETIRTTGVRRLSPFVFLF